MDGILNRCELYVVSESEIALRPRYTYLSGQSHTVVNYILLDAEAATSMTSCTVHEMDDLNTPDHLPLSAYLTLSAPLAESTEEIRWPRINGEKAALVHRVKLPGKHGMRLGAVLSMRRSAD